MPPIPATSIWSARQHADAVKRRDAFHIKFLEELIAACSPSQQLSAIDQIETSLAYDISLPFRSATILFTQKTYMMFSAMDVTKLASFDQATLAATVTRRLPVDLHHLLSNCDGAPHPDNDTWERVLDRLNEQAALAECSELAVRAFQKAHKPRAKPPPVPLFHETTPEPPPKRSRISAAESKSLASVDAENISSFKDKTITCGDCTTTFIFTAEKQAEFARKGWENEPKRCPTCREKQHNERKSHEARDAMIKENYSSTSAPKK